MLKRILGIDVGIASIGWALVEFQGDTDKEELPEGRILASGVRVFTQAENPKNGESLAKPRRDARLARRRNRRRAHRLAEIKNLFYTHKLVTGIPRNKINSIYTTEEGKKDPWMLRKEALRRKLEGEEFARILTHIAKHRGFKSMRKSEGEGGDTKAKETQRVLVEIAKNRQALSAGHYETAGEMIASRPAGEARRNKGESYTNSISRELLQDEIRVIFEKQRGLNSPFTSTDFEKEYSHIAFHQEPLQSMLKMVGFCTFEKDQKRAPKNSYSAEVFTALTKINNLLLKPKEADTDERFLTDAERKKALALCHTNAKVTFKQLRSELALSGEWLFNTMDYAKKPKNAAAKETEPEAATFFQMKGYHEIRRAAGKDLWPTICEKKEILNSIVSTLATEKSDDAIKELFKKTNVPEKIAEKALDLNFSGFLHLSIKALDKIIPFMLAGDKYTDACIKAGYDPLRPDISGKKGMLLRTLSEDENEQITNPVAKRAITQFRKVVNAIIRRHGKFDQMNIELARDLSNSFEKRREIKTGQKEFQAEKERAAERCKTSGVAPDSKDNLLKYRLWEQQDNGFCVYCGEPLEIQRLSEQGYCEVDHVLPYSRSLDGSMHNKVLAHIHDNQQKKNQIPFEYFGGDGPKWEEFVGRLNSQFKNLPKPKRGRLMKRKFDEKDMEGFKERNINDTRYISRFIKNFVENNLEFAESAQKQKVFVRSGALTAFLRHKWGLTKKRDESDRHHALDAITTACATQGMVKFAAAVSQKLESYDWLNKIRPHFDPPWQNFRNDVQKSLDSIFVSRAPRHKIGGAAHEETIRSAKHLEDGHSVIKTPLTRIELKDLENLFDKPHNEKLYQTLKARLQQFGDDPAKAFGDAQDPARMPKKSDGLGPIIRSIKLQSVQKSGIKVRKGIADNGEMPRIDVFEKRGKYYLVPIYVADFRKEDLPQKAIAANKPEKDWATIDESYTFKFSLYKDDLVKINSTGKPEDEKIGYYTGCHRGTGALNLDAQDRRESFSGIGARTLKSFKKLQVDALGNYFEVKKETRVGVIRKNGVADNTGSKAV